MAWLFDDIERTVGLVAYAGAAAACWLALGKRRERVWWCALAVAHTALTLDAALRLRHELTRWLAGLMGHSAWYGVRRPWQTAVIGGLVVALVALAVFIARRRARASTRLAAVLTLVGLGLVLAEVASLHQLDALLREPIGPMMAVAWGWAFVALGVIACAATRLRR